MTILKLYNKKIFGIGILLNKESKLHDIFSFWQHYRRNVTPERIKKEPHF